jgi:alpha-tubulin suppressor-like RCC1 family protein
MATEKSGFTYTKSCYTEQEIVTAAGTCSPVQLMYHKVKSVPDENDYYDEFFKGTTLAFIPQNNTKLYIWGENSTGQVGNNTAVDVTYPTWNHTDISRISAGQSNTAAIKTDGTLWLWGFGGSGQLGTNGIGDHSSPVQTISGGNNWKQVSVRNQHTAAIKTDGSLWLWGSGVSGRLGTNSTADHSSPVQTISGGTNWKQVSASCLNTAAIKTDGTLWLWGIGSNGQLGNNAVTSRSSPVQTISGGNNWKQVSANNDHTAAIKTDGSLWLWGLGSCGILGNNNSTTNHSSPVQTVSGGTNWKQVSAGLYHTAAIKTDGTLWLWGSGINGILGNNNSTTNHSSPVQTISGGTNWKQVSVGASTVAIKTDNTLWAWGACVGSTLKGFGTSCCITETVDYNDEFVRREFFSTGGLWGWGCSAYGSLGNNSETPESSPVQTVSGGTNWKQVVGGYDHTAAIKTDGTLWLWGYGGTGKLGNNSITNHSSPVQTVSGGTNWKQVSTGSQHTAAIKTDGTLWLWGSGFGGQLGNNAITNRSSPVQTISGGTNWKQVSYTSAIKTDGTLWLWGDGGGGRLGNNAETNHSSPVQTISGGTNWKQVSGSGHTAAIKTDGTLWLWGGGTNGQLGNNSIVAISSPTQTVSGGTNWKQVVTGGSHTAAIKTDGSLWLWGNGGWGMLGNNSCIGRSSPVQTISGGTNWKQVSGDQANTAAIKTDGTLWLWGCGTNGQLGTISTTHHSSPVQTVSGGTNWKQVSTGYWHTIAIQEDQW